MFVFNGCILFSRENNQLKPVFFSLAAPKLFPVAYNLVKHFLCENTRQKIYVLGGETLHIIASY